jgi:hypothetical protein
LSDHPVIADIDAFYMKTVVDADFSFRKYFTVKSAFIQPIARNLKNAYTNFQETVERFPTDRLTANTRKSFDTLIESVDLWLQRGVYSAETGALNYLWMAHPNTGIRGPTTPSEDHLNSNLRIGLNFLQENIRAADDTCLAPIVPSIVPSYQPYADAVVKAASDQIPKIDEQNFKNSLRSEAESVQATFNLISVLNNCALSSTTDSCIQNFVSLRMKFLNRYLSQFFFTQLTTSVDCTGCRFTDPFTGPSGFIAMDVANIVRYYQNALSDADYLLMNNLIPSEVSRCRRD